MPLERRAGSTAVERSSRSWRASSARFSSRCVSTRSAIAGSYRPRMAVKLHRCSFGWLQFDICSRVQSALDDMGIEYEVVVHPISRRKRQGMIELSGQKYYPVIEFEDGSIYREELEGAWRRRSAPASSTRSAGPPRTTG